MNQQHRVAVIEVGGRAVRLLVADVSLLSKLTNVVTSWKEVDLAAAVEVGGSRLNTTLREIGAIIKQFRGTANEQQPTQFAVFGTEALRRLEGNPLLEVLCGAVPDFKILSRKEEAELSFLAGVMGTGTRGDQTSLVIDQGSGSMEVVVGNVCSRGADMHFYKSYKLGTRELVKILRLAGSFDGLRKALLKRFSEYESLTGQPVGPPIVLGSAVTRLAWLSVKPEMFAQYDPRQIQGRILRLRHIDNLVQVAEQNPGAARIVVQPQNPNGSEFETVISGLIALEVFLKREKKNEFVVCCDGTRYGLAWKLALMEETQHSV